MEVEQEIKTSVNLTKESRTLIHLGLISHKLEESLNQSIKGYDISLQQFNVLRILRGQKGKPANLSTINERMVNKMSNTSRLVDKLITKNYAERITCPSNRRKVEITITKKGLENLLEIDKVIANKEETLLGGFTNEDFINFNNLLNKFNFG